MFDLYGFLCRSGRDVADVLGTRPPNHPWETSEAYRPPTFVVERHNYRDFEASSLGILVFRGTFRTI